MRSTDCPAANKHLFYKRNEKFPEERKPLMKYQWRQFFFYCCILSCRPEIPPFLINNFSISVWPVGKIFIFSRFERFFGNQTFFSHFRIICFYRVLWLCPALLNQIDSQHWCLPDFELTIARHLCDLKEF